MTSRPIYRFQRGEPVVIGRRVLSGDPSGVTVVALVKKSLGQVVPKASVPHVAVMTSQFQPASGQQPAHWTLTLTGEESSTMEPGQYAVDAKFMRDGEVLAISDPAFITLTESVSG